MRKVLLISFSFLSAILILIRFGTAPLEKILGIEHYSGIKIETNLPSDAVLDNVPIGKTPIQKENLSPGEHLLKLSSGTAFWQGYVKLYSGTLAIVNRELASSEASSSGEIITLGPGQGVTISSNPSSSDVEIDGKSVGSTPIAISNITAGEHQFNISHANYLKRSIRSIVTPGYNLSLSVDLAISEADLTQISSEPVKESVTLVVLQTPTGFLRVRDQASVSGSEIEQVKPGDKLILLEELPNWDRVRLPDGKEGYVSSSYIQKQSGQ